MKRKLEAKRGITLISLVITIVVLLILATVAISLAVDSDGLFKKAGQAANSWNNSVSKEQTEIESLLDKLNGIISVNTIEELRAALGEGKSVSIKQDITADASEMIQVDAKEYKAVVLQTNGGTIDGNDYTLSGNSSSDLYSIGIYTDGGTIENIKVRGTGRGIFIIPNTDVIIKNADLDTCYPLSSESKITTNHELTVNDSILNGWTSYSNVFSLCTFNNCKFGKDTEYSYAYCRPYAPTIFVNCEFEEGYEVDARRNTITFENCKYNGELVTTENVGEFIQTNESSNVTVR